MTEPEGALTTGEAYRLLAGGADEATGAGSALGYVYVAFCLCGRAKKRRSHGKHVAQAAEPPHSVPSPNI